MFKFTSVLIAAAFYIVLVPVQTFASESKGGFSLGATRVIYDAAKKEATVNVLNTADNAPFLAQSWISNLDENAQASMKPPFVITPPLYRQDKGQNTLRIVKSAGALPQDRESAFWVNVKAIPAQPKSNKELNTVSFAYVLKIKMFYRPSGLNGSASDAYKELTFSRNGAELIVNNPTPYFVTLNKISVGGKEIKDTSAMVPPRQQQRYSLAPGANGSSVEYRAINDLGGVTPSLTRQISN